MTIDLPNGEMTCFVASPDDRPAGPVIVVIQEWWGLNEQIRGVARRFTSAGFTALAPDLYRGQQAEEPDDARKLAMELDRGAAAEDVRAIARRLLEDGATKVGVTGFCMGGGIAWTVARTESAISAAVPFYGAVDFHEGGPALAPFQAHYGTKDRFPREMYEQIERHLDDAPGSELWRYPGAGHAFMNEDGHSFDPDAAALAWERTVGFFRRHLADQPA